MANLDRVRSIVRDSLYDYYTRQYLAETRSAISSKIAESAVEHDILTYDTGIRSTCLSNVMYDRTARQLAVQFKTSGRVYVYYDEDYSTYERLVSAPSVGRYYNYNIKLS